MFCASHEEQSCNLTTGLKNHLSLRNYRLLGRTVPLVPLREIRSGDYIWQCSTIHGRIDRTIAQDLRK